MQSKCRREGWTGLVSHGDAKGESTTGVSWPSMVNDGKAIERAASDRVVQSARVETYLRRV